jgi:hypothetical protein
LIPIKLTLNSVNNDYKIGGLKAEDYFTVHNVSLSRLLNKGVSEWEKTICKIMANYIESVRFEVFTAVTMKNATSQRGMLIFYTPLTHEDV